MSSDENDEEWNPDEDEDSGPGYCPGDGTLIYAPSRRRTILDRKLQKPAPTSRIGDVPESFAHLFDCPNSRNGMPKTSSSTMSTRCAAYCGKGSS